MASVLTDAIDSAIIVRMTENNMNDGITLIAGDIHVHPDFLDRISRAADAISADRIVMLGDYMDYWNANTSQRVGMAAALKDWQDDESRHVDILLGNHDVPYYAGTNDRLFKGFIVHRATGMDPLALNDVHAIYSRMRMPIATTVMNPATGDEYLCSHAGITCGWMLKHLGIAEDADGDGNAVNARVIADRLNDMQSHGGWRELYACGIMRNGHDGHPSPLWADLKELEYDPVHGLNQIVGHTPVDTIHIDMTASYRLVFCDTMSFMSNDMPIGDGSLLAVGTDVRSSDGSFAVRHMAPGLHVIALRA